MQVDNVHLKMRWTRHVACMGEKKIAYRVLVGKPKRNRPPGRHNVDKKVKLSLCLIT
jgi:hypothetical protein